MPENRRDVTFRGSLATYPNYLSRVRRSRSLGRVSPISKKSTVIIASGSRRLLEIHRKHGMTNLVVTNAEVADLSRPGDDLTIPLATINSPFLRLHLFMFLGSGTALLKRKPCVPNNLPFLAVAVGTSVKYCWTRVRVGTCAV